MESKKLIVLTRTQDVTTFTVVGGERMTIRVCLRQTERLRSKDAVCWSRNRETLDHA